MGFDDLEYQLLSGLVEINKIVQKLSEDPEISINTFDIQEDVAKDSHILIVWKGSTKLDPIAIPDTQIRDCSLSEEYQEAMERYLRKELGSR